MIINFECSNCNSIFDCDIGSVAVSEETFRPIFEKKIICIKCGERTIDEVFLTELGQSQLTEATFGSEIDDNLDDDNDILIDYDSNDSNIAECQGCDLYLPVDDQGLCIDCSKKLERDLIREREWDYSYTCYGIDPSLREKLRNDIIKKYGVTLELISPSAKSNKNKVKRSRNKKHKKKSR